MVQGIPKNLTTKEAEDLMKEVFTSIFIPEKVIMTRAQPLQNDLF
jgi:hypothetical protein